MERSGPLFDNSPDAVLGRFDGLTLAVGPSGIDGYAGWNREPGYDASGRLRVSDFFALTPAANAALVAMLGTWANVAPTIVMRLADRDPATLLAPFANATVEARDPWMLRILDAAGAVAARGWPPHLCGSVDFALDDAVCPWNTGSWRLVLDGGPGRLEAGGSGAVRPTMRGFAVLYAGAASPALLRRAGLLAGGDAVSDAFLAAASGSPPPTLLDSF